MDKNTLGTYQKAGLKYLKSIAKAYPKDIEMFARMLPKSGFVLDVGCAGGRDSKIFIKTGKRVLGIDVIDQFLEVARRSVAKAIFKKIDVRNIPFKPLTFDGIWCSAMLHHQKRIEIKAIVKSFFRLLKKGGLVYIREKYGRGSVIKYDDLVGGTRRIIYFTTKQMESNLRSAGFRIISSEIQKDSLGRSELRWVRIIAVKP